MSKVRMIIEWKGELHQPEGWIEVEENSGQVEIIQEKTHWILILREFLQMLGYRMEFEANLPVPVEDLKQSE
ncbi:MAG: hypothetical protein J7J61_07495 [Candidatus Hydrothermae bacterium]|nr:hypothetical protein [Candidatus Hydrothermae bacterium]